MYIMQKFVEQISSLGASGDAGPPPDLRFGYTPDQLYDWYDNIGGKQGCLIYKNMYVFDLFPYMVSPRGGKSSNYVVIPPS